MLKFSILQPHSKDLNYGLVLDSSERPEAVLADQIHSDIILKVNSKPETMPQADGFVTDQQGLMLMVEVADCQGILIYDPVTHSIAAVHSGWRGSAQNIIGKTIGKMKKEYGSSPTDLLIGISPSLGPCCAEFSDPNNELPDFCHPFIDEKNHVDFWALSQRQCQQAGVPESQIELARKCTKCQPDFVSYRNGDSGRMGVFVTLL